LEEGPWVREVLDEVPGQHHVKAFAQIHSLDIGHAKVVSRSIQLLDCVAQNVHPDDRLGYCSHSCMEPHTAR